MRKAEARALFRRKRAELTPVQTGKWDDLLLIAFQQAQLPFLERVLSFYPAEGKTEVDSFLLTRYLAFTNPGLEVAFPRVRTDGTMEAVVPAHEEDFVPNSYNILEPAEGVVISPRSIDLVLVPLLAYDEGGNRVGYGKGYYDRFLARCRPDCLKTGVSYFGPVDRLDDADEFDIPLDLCITPHKVYVF